MYLTNDYRGVIIALVMVAIIIVISCFCCYCCWKIYRKNGGIILANNSFSDPRTGTTTHVVVQRSPSVTGTVRTVTVPQPSSRVVRLIKMETFNQPSSDNSHSNTNNTEPPPTEPPPPYSNTDAPPSYSEIDV